MADHIVPHFHNDIGVDSIAIGAQRIHVHRRAAALRPSAHLHRHGRRGRGDLLLLLDRLPLRSEPATRPRRGRPAASIGRPPLKAGMRIAIAGGRHRRPDLGGRACAARFRGRVFERASGSRRSAPASSFLQTRRRCWKGWASWPSSPEKSRSRRRSPSATRRSGALLARMPLGRSRASAIRQSVLHAPPRRSAGGAACRRAAPDRRIGHARRRSLATLRIRHGGRLHSGRRKPTRRHTPCGRRRSFKRSAPNTSATRSRHRSVEARGAQLFPRRILRSIISANEIGLWLGAGGHLVHYPVNARADLNIVVIASGAMAPPAQLALRSDASAARSNPPRGLYRRSWESTRHDRGRVGEIVLIGDAAHAMAPSAAQGGAIAIEDAWVLAEMLAPSPSDPTKALASLRGNARATRIARVASLALRESERLRDDWRSSFPA